MAASNRRAHRSRPVAIASAARTCVWSLSITVRISDSRTTYHSRHPPGCYGQAMSTNVTAPALPFDPIARAARTWSERIGPSTAMSAVTNVMRVQQILQASVDEKLKPHGLSFARYEALVLLSFSKRGSLPMRMMGERLQLHPTSITNIVDRLEADGLARRLPHPSDRRTTLVELTDAGRERLAATTEAVTAANFAFVGLEEGELVQLSRMLTKVRRAAGDFA